MTDQEHVDRVTDAAAVLAGRLSEAQEAGVSVALLLPALVGVFRESGMIPDGMSLPGLPL